MQADKSSAPECAGWSHQAGFQSMNAAGSFTSAPLVWTNSPSEPGYCSSANGTKVPGAARMEITRLGSLVLDQSRQVSDCWRCERGSPRANNRRRDGGVQTKGLEGCETTPDRSPPPNSLISAASPTTTTAPLKEPLLGAASPRRWVAQPGVTE